MMRNLLSLFTALVALQSTAAEHTSTITGNRTQDDSRDKSALAFHPKIHEYDTPRILGKRGPANIEDGHVHSYNEERVESAWMAAKVDILKSYLSSALNLYRRGSNANPAGIQVENEALNAKLMQWTTNRESDLTVDAAVQQLVTNGVTKQFVADLVVALDDVRLGDISYSLLKKLVEKNEDSAKLVLDVFLEARVPPEIVFHVLPVYRNPDMRVLRDPEMYPEFAENLEQIVQYSDKFNSLLKTKPDRIRSRVPKESTNDLITSEDFAVEILVRAGDPHEVVAFLRYLQRQNRLPKVFRRAYQVLSPEYQVHMKR